MLYHLLIFIIIILVYHSLIKAFTFLINWIFQTFLIELIAFTCNLILALKNLYFKIPIMFSYNSPKFAIRAKSWLPNVKIFLPCGKENRIVFSFQKCDKGRIIIMKCYQVTIIWWKFNSRCNILELNGIQEWKIISVPNLN